MSIFARLPPRVALAAGALLLTSSCSVTRETLCTITPIHAGICQIGADHVYGPPHTADERVPFVIYAFLVEGPNGETALIDLGPESLEYCNAMFLRHGFFRDLGAEKPPGERYPDNIVQPRGNVFAQLTDLGVRPEEIDHIVFTHLHADHHGMDDATDGGASERFPNARLHVSRKGWEDNLARRREAGGNWASYVDYEFADFLLRREAEGRASFEDDIEVFPGLRTMYLGGHSVCSQAVVVDTAQGTAVIASDDIYHFHLLERNILPAIRTSEAKYREAIERVVSTTRATNGVIVPLHDMQIWKSYESAGTDWLGDLRKYSDRALAGYRPEKLGAR